MLSAILISSHALLLAPKATFPLTIESIMRGPALVGYPPKELRWSPDGMQLRFSWAKADGSADPPFKEFVVKRDGSGLAPALGVTPVDSSGIPKGSKFGDQIVYDALGELYTYDVATKTTKKITDSAESKRSPKFVDDGKGVVYASGDNLFRLNLADGKSTQLTDLQKGSTSTPAASAKPLTPLISVRIPSGFRSGTFVLSPNGACASIDLTQPAQGGKRADVPNYVTESGFPEMISTFVRVGGPQSRNKTLIVDLRTGAEVEMATVRPGRVMALRWSPDGKYAVAMAEAEDHKDEWIFGFDASSDKVSMLWDEHCDAWVGGPGRGTLGWLPDGSKFYFHSERNGYASLLAIPAGGGDAIPLVEGNFEVSDIKLDTDRQRFTFVSSEGSPYKRHLDWVSLSGGTRTKIADLSADEESTYAIAPNGQDVAVVRSKVNRPGELYINDVQVTTTPTAEWLSGTWIEPPVVMIPSSEGLSVSAHLYKPKHWRRGGPAVVFVHGAGYLQNVYDGWSYYYREYMFHHFLMDHGYEVLDMDYRGSAGYGRDWRTAIYRHMGGKDLDDEVAGADWLVRTQGVAKKRIGIYGGSYGGFLTLMAMFTKPDVFAAGAALRPVGDWSTYNHGYTSEILNLPQDDKEAYRQSSPINFVEGLKGALLICHGMIDTNVPFQDSVRIAERLIELGKTNWEIAPFPVEDHGFTRAASWTDEYRRIFDLFERTVGSKSRR